MPSRLAVLAAAGILALVGWAGGSAGAPVAASGPPAASGQAFAKGRIIVSFQPGASADRRAGAVASVQARGVERLSPIARDGVVMKLPPGLTVAAAIEVLSRRPGVAFVEPDYVVTTLASSNDPYYTNGSLWGMHGATTSHPRPFGSAAGEAWAAGATGSSSVFVGVIDEGVMHTHPDLAANVWANPFDPPNGADDDGNGYVDDVHGWDFFHDDASVYDGTSASPADDHGTHVAGTIGARGGNGIGVAGVNWHVTLISAKFLGPSGGYTSDAIRALDYLTDLKVRHGLNIVATNNSWGGGGHSQALLDAINRAGDAGILFVAAAGNNGTNNDASPRYPSSYQCTTRANGQPRGWDCVISVASITSNGARSGFSNYGATSVDLGAPGSSITSTVPGGYVSISGTSMATPHVTGGLALCASMDATLTARQLRERLFETLRPTSSMSGVTVTGGRLDVGRLAERCTPGSTGPGPSPSPVPPLGGSLTRIVDDLDAGFRPSGSGWRSAATGFRKHHHWVPVRRNTVRRSAAWRVTLDAPGRYQVKVKIPRQNATTRSAAYRVKTANGFVTRVLNQRQRRGDWVGLGIHELERDVVVRLTDKTGEGGGSGRRVAFDAIKLIPRDGTSTATRRVDPEVSDTRPDAPDGGRDSDRDAAREPSTSPVDATPTPALEASPEPEAPPEPEVPPEPEATPEPEVAPEPEATPDRDPSRPPGAAAPSPEPSPGV